MAGKAKSKKGKKPNAKHLASVERVGSKKAPASKGEVGGKMSPGAIYACWNCGNTSFVPFGWDDFICPYCAALNRV